VEAAAASQYAYTTSHLRWSHKRSFKSPSDRQFSGSPVDLRYRYRLERGLIAMLEITPREL
jgi:hypothetical protein